MSRGLSLERIIEYFETVNLRVGEITVQVASETLAERRKHEEHSARSQATRLQPAVRKQRKRKGTLAGAVSGGQAALPNEPNGQESLANA